MRSLTLALKNVNAILFYHSKTLLYQYTIPFYNSSASKNSIFIKILFFNPFFIISSQPFSLIFLGFSTAIFISLSQHRFNTQHTPIIHRSTYPNLSPHSHTHTHTHKHNPATKPSHTHKHNPATKPSHTHKHKPIQKPGHRSKTQARPPIHAADQPIHAADLQPRPPIKNRSKPIQKKSLPEQTHSKNIITGATEQTHSLKSSPEPSEQIHSKK